MNTTELAAKGPVCDTNDISNDWCEAVSEGDRMRDLGAFFEAHGRRTYTIRYADVADPMYVGIVGEGEAAGWVLEDATDGEWIAGLNVGF